MYAGFYFRDYYKPAESLACIFWTPSLDEVVSFSDFDQFQWCVYKQTFWYKPEFICFAIDLSKSL